MASQYLGRAPFEPVYDLAQVANGRSCPLKRGTADTAARSEQLNGVSTRERDQAREQADDHAQQQTHANTQG